jgi:hypothetical protein
LMSLDLLIPLFARLVTPFANLSSIRRPSLQNGHYQLCIQHRHIGLVYCLSSAFPVQQILDRHCVAFRLAERLQEVINPVSKFGFEAVRL